MAGARVRIRVAVATAATLVAAIGGLAVAPAAPVAAAPVLTVTPSQDLLHGHPVHAAATGLSPGAHYWIAQCGAAPATDCARHFMLDNGPLITVRNAAFVTASPNGAASADLRVQRHLRVEDVAKADCTAGGCVVAVLDEHGEPVTSLPITFTAEGTYQWGPAQLTATPTTGLVEGQTIALTASGLDPEYAPIPPVQDPTPAAFIDVCRAVEDPGPDDCFDGNEFQDWAVDPVFYVETDADGTAEGGFAVHRYLPLPSGTVDCAVEACTVAVTQGDNPVSNRVPLSFGPEWGTFTTVGLFVDTLGELRGRPYTGQERSALIAALTSRQTKGADALASAALEGAVAPGTTSRLAEVTRLYRAYFGRLPGASGLLYWTGRMHEGLTSVEVGRLFGGTPEFRATYGTASNAAVVDAAYRNTLGRAPDPSGLAYWTARLDQGLARWKMIHGFARSPEFVTRERPRVAIMLLTWVFEGRRPTGHEVQGSPRSLRPEAGSVRNVAVDLMAAQAAS